jgi:hypothetical protein
VQDRPHLYRADHASFLYEAKGSPDEYLAALKLAIDRGWLWAA